LALHDDTSARQTVRRVPLQGRPFRPHNLAMSHDTLPTMHFDEHEFQASLFAIPALHELAAQQHELDQLLIRRSLEAITSSRALLQRFPLDPWDA
jgi:hypothetical protein